MSDLAGQDNLKTALPPHADIVSQIEYISSELQGLIESRVLFDWMSNRVIRSSVQGEAGAAAVAVRLCRALSADIVMSLGRMLDPSRYRDRRNVSIAGLADALHIAGSERAEYDRIVGQFAIRKERLVEARNRQYGHADHEYVSTGAISKVYIGDIDWLIHSASYCIDTLRAKSHLDVFQGDKIKCAMEHHCAELEKVFCNIASAGS